MNKYVSIITDIASSSLDKPFYYSIPKDLESKIMIGSKVVFPFGKSNKLIEGFVVAIHNDITDFDKNLVKEVKDLAKNKISINDILLKMALFMSDEYGTPLNLCLKTVLPVKRTVRKNSKQLDISKEYEKNEDEALSNKPILNTEQKKIVDDILQDMKSINTDLPNNSNNTHLLYGITGSGKTEVYMNLIEEVIKYGKKVIVLIPEISLTYQTVIRLSKRFRGKVAIIHSKMSEGEKYIQYNKCLTGEIDILVGPRSAIFAPFENLGLIVIDEEHDHSYKSETSPRYDTIKLAEYRAKEQNAILLLGSATPSLKTYTRAKNNEIKLHKLTKRACEDSKLAKTTVVDLREEFKNKNNSIFSKELYKLIQEKLENKEQIMLFMNRRGFSNMLNCRSCGHTITCPHCSISLTVHNDSVLRCHYCGYEIKEPLACPECHSPHIAPFGVGTEKLEIYTKKTFPNARIARMDADTTQRKGAMDSIIQKFRNKEIDILIGTQMIVKGHDFPNVTLVGIMAADMSLYNPDYKSAENTFQLLTQCAGRSGRALSGDVVIQTYEPNNYCIECAAEQDYDKFYDIESKFRKDLNYPPFCNMLVFEISCVDEMLLNQAASKAKAFLDTTFSNVQIFGPTKANVYKIKDSYRNVFYIKSQDENYLKNIRNELVLFFSKKEYKNAIKYLCDIE